MEPPQHLTQTLQLTWKKYKLNSRRRKFFFIVNIFLFFYMGRPSPTFFFCAQKFRGVRSPSHNPLCIFAIIGKIVSINTHILQKDEFSHSHNSPMIGKLRGPLHHFNSHQKILLSINRKF